MSVTRSDAESPAAPLHTRIFAGLSLGATGGLAGNLLAADSAWLRWLVRQIAEPVGQLFLNLLLMLVVPLVFSTLVTGVAGIGDLRRLGRVGVRSFSYCIIISAVSVCIGLALANLIEPGRRIAPDTAAALAVRYGSAAAERVEKSAAIQEPASPLTQLVDSLIPTNPIASLAAPTPNMLHLMFFALALGTAVTMLPREQTAGFVDAVEGLSRISARLIELVMQLAPYAVFCLLFASTAQFGVELLASLGWFVVTVLLGLTLHLLGTYSLSLRLLSGMRPAEFFRRIRVVMLTAFSTSSSNATLPTTLRISEENLGVPKEVNSFVLTLGATANQNGTALYEGITVLFLAQLAGVELSVMQQLLVLYLAILGGIGTAGIPAASLPFIAGVLATLGVNPALIAVILGLDRILDMCRTVVNVVGDLTAATYVARAEGHEWPPELRGSRRSR